MAVDAEPGIIWKVRTELDEERPEVFIDTIGGKRFAAMFTKEPCDPAQILETHLDDLQIDPVERFDLDGGQGNAEVRPEH